jgi:hypothetical protein
MFNPRDGSYARRSTSFLSSVSGGVIGGEF